MSNFGGPQSLIHNSKIQKALEIEKYLNSFGGKTLPNQTTFCNKT